MATVIVVTSGKGGVGKTTSTAALGAALAQSGQNVVVVDFDVGLRNLDLVMGAERRVVFDLINVVQGDAKLPQALIRDKRIDTLSLLPASQTRDKDALTAEGVTRVIAELREKFDWINLRQSRRHRAWREPGHASCGRGRGGHEPGSFVSARLGPDHRHARLEDRKGRARRTYG
jgi:septum site-determining protein MinD